MPNENLQEPETSDRNFCLGVVLAGVAVMICALPLSVFDTAVFEYFKALGAVSLKSVMRLTSETGTGVVLGAIALLAFAAMRSRRAAVRVALSLLLATILVSVLKNVITRQRPTAQEFNSFPSGHSASAFAVAGALFLYLRKWGIPFLAVAAAVAFSRIFCSSHYLSDVVAGTGLGLICAGGAGLMLRRAPGFVRLRIVRLFAGALALGFTVFPWIKDKNTLSQLVLIVMPPIAFYAFWSYLPSVMAWGRRVFAGLSERRLLALIFVACVFLFLIGNWASTLFDRDEGWYAAISREMLVSGDYLTPTYNGKPFLEKPPLPYWLMAGSMRLFGANAFGARFPSAIAGAGACVMLFLLARSMFDRKTALASAAVFATSFLTLFVMRAALTDSFLVFLLLLSFYGFWRIFRGDASRLPWLLLYGGAGLAFLTKYLAGVAIIGLAALATIVLLRRWDLLRKARIPTGALFFLAIAGAWFVPAYISTEGEVLRVFYEHNFDRAQSAMQGHSGPFFYYILMLPLIFFPWFSLLPGALTQKREEIAPKSERWWFLVSWAGGTVLLFSVVSTKLPHYVFPALPALSILVGALLSNADARAVALAGWKRYFACFFLGLIGLAVSVGLIVGLEQGKFYNCWRFFTPACGVLLLVTVLAIVDLGRRQVLRAAATLAGGMLTFVLLLVLVALPSLNQVKLPAPIGRIIAEKSRPEDAILHWGYVPPTLVFYSQRDFIIVRTREELDSHIGAAGRAFCVLPAWEVRELGVRGRDRFNIKGLLPPKPNMCLIGFDTGRGKWIDLQLIQVEVRDSR